MPRQPERDQLRLHDVHPPHPNFAQGGPPQSLVNLGPGPPPPPLPPTAGHPGAPPPNGVLLNGNGPPPLQGGPPGPPPPPNGGLTEVAIQAGVPVPKEMHPAIARLASANEQTWLLLGGFIISYSVRSCR
jgi:hypothetical protein